MSRTIETTSTPDVLNGGDHVTTDRQVPFCVFADQVKIPTEGVLRAHTLSETRGFLKALVEINGDRILGFTVRGSNFNDRSAALYQAARSGSDASAVTKGLIPLFASRHP